MHHHLKSTGNMHFTSGVKLSRIGENTTITYNNDTNELIVCIRKKYY